MSDLNETLLESAARHRKVAEIIEAFAGKCSESWLSPSVIASDCGDLSIVIALTAGARGERTLAAAGDAFGRSGWRAKLNYRRDGYDWSKETDGIKLMIFDAAHLPDAESGFDVPPSAFPLQLEEGGAQ